MLKCIDNHVPRLNPAEMEASCFSDMFLVMLISLRHMQVVPSFLTVFL